MFKCVYIFLLLEMLLAAAQGADLCRSDIQTSLADFKSDIKALQDLVHDLRTRLGQQFEWPVQNVKPSAPITIKESKVAFFVARSRDLGPFTKNTDIVFDSIVTNIGSAYSVSTGRFTAPVTAAYQFSVTVGAQNTKKAAVELMKNGVRIMTAWSGHTREWSPSSAESILWLKAGDQVWLQLLTQASNVHGNMYTTFSGFLIFEN